MKEKIISIFNTSTFKQTLITSSGTILSGIFGLIFYIFMARILEPVGFGIFSVTTATTALLASIANMGIDTGIVRFVGKYYRKDLFKVKKILKYAFKVKILSIVFLNVLGWFLMPVIASTILQKPELLFPLRLSLLGAATSMLLSFVVSTIQAIQKFVVWSILTTSINILRLIILGVLIYFSLININSGIYLYILIPFVGFFAGLLFVPSFFKAKKENEVSKELFNYNKWIAIFTLIVAVSSRVDTFITTRLLSLSEVGIYSVAVNLSSIVPSIVLALGTVVAPKLSSFSSDNEAKKYLEKLQLFVVFLAVIGILVGIPLSYFVIPKLYGVEYLSSIYPFFVLLVTQAVFLVSIPSHSAIFYYFSQPKIFIYISLVHLLSVSIVGWVLTNNYGYMGASVSMLLGNIINFILPFRWVYRRLYRKK
ncbi:oligosaccharide flippase family protein [Patescibacteria group bacterium]